MIKKIILFILITTSVAYANNDFLSDREKEFLVNLSRQTLYWYLRYDEMPVVSQNELTEDLKLKKACFVSLHNKDLGLRGCMGMFPPINEPLFQNVINRTIDAVKDPRFRTNPLNYNELKDIKLEISILTDPVYLKFNSPQELLNKLQPNNDGVILTTKFGSSTYLPQVWQQLPDKKEFLTNLCLKQGAPPNFWQTNFKDIKIQIYQAVVFGEELYGRKIVGKNGAVVGENGAFLLGHVKVLKEDLYYGGYKVGKGTKLMPGTIVTSDSDIIEN